MAPRPQALKNTKTRNPPSIRLGIKKLGLSDLWHRLSLSDWLLTRYLKATFAINTLFFFDTAGSWVEGIDSMRVVSFVRWNPSWWACLSALGGTFPQGNNGDNEWWTMRKRPPEAALWPLVAPSLALQVAPERRSWLDIHCKDTAGIVTDSK